MNTRNYRTIGILVMISLLGIGGTFLPILNEGVFFGTMVMLGAALFFQICMHLDNND